MTDDVDALLFGAKVIIRKYVPSSQFRVYLVEGVLIFHSLSVSLSGNMSNPATDGEGKSSKHHVKVFRADEIKDDTDIGLTKGGMILFALLSGGDYSGVRSLFLTLYKRKKILTYAYLLL